MELRPIPLVALWVTSVILSTSASYENGTSVGSENGTSAGSENGKKI